MGIRHSLLLIEIMRKESSNITTEVVDTEMEKYSNIINNP